jgi:hypothetical protein
VALRQLLRDAGEQNMVYVYYQTHGGGSDTLWNINDSLRIQYYGLTSVPTTYADGCSSHVGSLGSIQADSIQFARWYNARRAVQSPLQMTLTGFYNRISRQGRAKVVITATGNIVPTNLRIRYLLLENLPYVWGSPPVTGIDHVQRNMMPDWNGVPLTISNGQTKADSQSFALQPGWNPDSCEIAVFVQSDQTKEILQGVWTDLRGFYGIEGSPSSDTPVAYYLSSPSPSPFSRRTQVFFGLPREAEVSLKVYNLMGQEVETLVAGRKEAGSHTVSWDARDESGRPVPGGVYFLRLVADGQSLTRRAVVLR